MKIKRHKPQSSLHNVIKLVKKAFYRAKSTALGNSNDNVEWKNQQNRVLTEYERMERSCWWHMLNFGDWKWDCGHREGRRGGWEWWWGWFCWIEWRRGPCPLEMRRRCHPPVLKAHGGSGHQPLDSPWGHSFLSVTFTHVYCWMAVSALFLLVESQRSDSILTFCPGSAPSVQAGTVSAEMVTGSTSHMLNLCSNLLSSHTLGVCTRACFHGLQCGQAEYFSKSSCASSMYLSPLTLYCKQQGGMRLCL